jgi:hypothetical protein
MRDASTLFLTPTEPSQAAEEKVNFHHPDSSPRQQRREMIPRVHLAHPQAAAPASRKVGHDPDSIPNLGHFRR